MGAEQKVAIITGASQGIGEALVKGYRDRNYRVVANSRSNQSFASPSSKACIQSAVTWRRWPSSSTCAASWGPFSS